jgi:hypothetical protein
VIPASFTLLRFHVMRCCVTFLLRRDEALEEDTRRVSALGGKRTFGLGTPNGSITSVPVVEPTSVTRGQNDDPGGRFRCVDKATQAEAPTFKQEALARLSRYAQRSREQAIVGHLSAK